MSKQSIKSAFDKAAATYDSSALLQQEVTRRLEERLGLMKFAPSTILDAGCGTGFAMPLLQARYPEARLVGLDLSVKMLSIARAATPRPGLVTRAGLALGLKVPSRSARMVCADIRNLPLASDCIDMVWSSLALQWAEDLEGTFQEFRRSLKAEGLLLFSTFGPDTLKELRAAFNGLDGYGHVNRFLDMHDIGDSLVRAGFHNPVMEMEYLTLTYSELRDLLRDLKAIGAQTVTMNRRRGLMGRAQWRQFERNYENFRRNGRLPATYEVIYGHAWTGSKDRLLDDRRTIRLNVMRGDGG